MYRNPEPGRFIVLEGLDGSGTTTQARLLHRALAELGQSNALTQEPTYGPIGVQLRAILTGRLHADELTIAYLFAADRLDHMARMRSPLHAGDHVICDRSYLSSLAYQSLASDMGWIYELNSQSMQPDLTLFLDVPPRVCWERITVNRGTHYELFEEREKLEQIDRRYHEAIEYLRQRGETIHQIDGTAPVETVHEQIKAAVLPLIRI